MIFEIARRTCNPLGARPLAKKGLSIRDVGEGVGIAAIKQAQAACGQGKTPAACLRTLYRWIGRCRYECARRKAAPDARLILHVGQFAVARKFARKQGAHPSEFAFNLRIDHGVNFASPVRTSVRIAAA
jgi:hypothetical protein